MFNPVCKAPTGQERGDLLVRISRLMRALSDHFMRALSAVSTEHDDFLHPDLACFGSG